MRTFVLGTVLAILSALGTPGASAQEQQVQDKELQRNRNASTEQDKELQRNRNANKAKESGSNTDEALVACMVIDNWAEMEIAKFAAGKAQSPEVRQFAEMLQKEHSEFVTKLKEVNPNAVDANQIDFQSTNRATDQRKDLNETRRDGDKDTVRPNVDRAAGVDRQAGIDRQAGVQSTVVRDEKSHGHSAGSNHTLLSIKKEIAQACVNTLQQELGAKSQAEFDRCFIDQQVMAHMHMLDTLKVFERHASPELGQVINQATQATQKHLERAKQLKDSSDLKVTDIR